MSLLLLNVLLLLVNVLPFVVVMLLLMWLLLPLRSINGAVVLHLFEVRPRRQRVPSRRSREGENRRCRVKRVTDHHRAACFSAATRVSLLLLLVL